MSREPDSDFRDGIGENRRIDVYLTPEHEFPSSGSVTLQLHYSRFQSTTLKITRAEARSALEQIAVLLEESDS